MNEFAELAIETAKASPCNKRKVGAVLVRNNKVVGKGHNYNPFSYSCEDETGKTKAGVRHAEVAAILDAQSTSYTAGATMYVTHPPCKKCLDAIKMAGILEVKVVEEFMKFDTDKLRYDLVPPEAIKALAEVLTYGAKKYKPNNWQNVDDKGRYIAALYRHLEAWRSGEAVDEESKMSHLHHAITNLAFLIYFESKN